MRKSTIVGVCILVVAIAISAFVIGTRFGGREVESERVRDRQPKAEGVQEGGRERAGEVRLEREGQESADIETMIISRGTLAVTLDANGEVQANPNQAVKVGSFVRGRVSKLLVGVGDEVRARRTLAIVDSSDVAQARAAYEQARERLHVAQEKLTNTRKLSQAGVFTQKSVDDARKERNQVASEFAAMRVTFANDLASTESGAKTAQASYDRAEHNRQLAEAELQRRKALVQAGAVQYKPLEDARREMSEAQAAQTTARAQSRFADSNLARMQRLYEGGTKSKREVEEAEAGRADATASLQRANVRVNIATQVLAREQKIFDEKIYAQREIQQAEVDLARAERETAEKAAELEEAKKHLELARSSQKQTALREMENRLRALDSVLGRETNVARQKLYGFKEEQAAQAEVAQARLELHAAQNALRLLRASASTSQLASVPIISPMSGRVLERLASVGEVVDTTTTLFTVLDLSSVWVQANVFEKDVRRVRVGQPVMLTATAFPNETFRGTVGYIGDAVDPKTRTVSIRCAIANPDRKLKPEMFVQVKIMTSTRRALTVPEGAVQEMEGKRVVYIAIGPASPPDRFQRREVEIGETAQGRVEILRGLKQGERIVARGAFRLKAQQQKGEFGESEED